ncbi:MAG: alkaline phosphatase family protein [Gemmatimonadetes bacterium]|nr:alkaline phosphatase family protein [Gemmatimonadota bacterium]
MRCRLRAPVALATLAVSLLAPACADRATAPPELELAVARLEVVSGDGQQVWTGRRAAEPFVVRAVGRDGRPVSGTMVRFTVEGAVGGVLSQPMTLTDDNGLAETYLLDAAGRGEGRIRARAGDASATFDLSVMRAPALITFTPGTGEAGLPGFPHPDSVVEALVRDREGEPVPGMVVWFAAFGEISAYNDTTDMQGHARTILRRTPLLAGNASVYAFILGFNELTVSTPRPTVPVARKVVLVSIDGLRADVLSRYHPPRLERLAGEGAWAEAAETVFPSLTVPAHLSLLAGVSPERHGVFSDRIRLTPQMAEIEPLFRRARRGGRAAAAFLTETGPLAAFREVLECRLAFGLDSLALSGTDGGASAALAASALAGAGLDLVFVHIPDPDQAGHAYGWNSNEYGRAVLRADTHLGLILDALGSAADSTLVIVTSDHGGGGAYGPYLHGSNAPADRIAPFVLWGRRVRPGRLDAASILDLAPTALWALGMAPPAHYEGKPLLSAFR